VFKRGADLIDVILADNTRPACGGPPLIRYSAGGVYLALAKKKMDVRWVDLMTDPDGPPSSVEYGDPSEACCFAVFFGNKVNAFRLMENARSLAQKPRLIIAFGPFASVFSEEILTRGLADIVVSHDPEFVIPLLLKEGSKPSPVSTIPNLSYMHEGKVIHTQKHSYHDLDEVPFISPFLYEKGQRPAVIMATRGCQYHCVFCDRNVLWGGGVRKRSVANVLEEIRELIEVHHVKEFEFLDEDLAADQKFLVALCEGIRKIKGDFHWFCSACVDSVNQKLLLLMGHSRCKEVFFGVESASPQVLRKIGKKYGRQEILDSVRWAREAGLRVEVMLTTGNSGETDQDRDLTLSAIQEMGTSGISLRTNRLVILPGTAYYRKGLKEGWFTPKSFFEDEWVIFYDEDKYRHS